MYNVEYILGFISSTGTSSSCQPPQRWFAGPEECPAMSYYTMPAMPCYDAPGIVRTNHSHLNTIGSQGMIKANKDGSTVSSMLLRQPNKNKSPCTPPITMSSQHQYEHARPHGIKMSMPASRAQHAWMKGIKDVGLLDSPCGVSYTLEVRPETEIRPEREGAGQA